jgi:hypothetical protein
VQSPTRKPKLLVKMPSGPPQVALRFGSSKLDVNVEPLFKSIKPAAKARIAQAPEWHLLTPTSSTDEINSWDLCHQVMTKGMGLAGLNAVEFAEPDIDQQWSFGREAEHALALAAPCGDPWNPNPRLPVGVGDYWFRDGAHSQLQLAREEVGEPARRVRIAHFDTGYAADHITKPKFLRTDLQKNFADDGQMPDDATDRSAGTFNNLGHGTGTLSLLAGAIVDGIPLGAAANLDVIPIRVANAVVLFKNSAIAQALDYVHSLANDPNTRVHVITMSMGGLASQAWADAVNALYDLGVFIVTAAGNNFGNFPTHNIVYPARFKRVVAACGVMADGRPYADLPLKIMAGNYGPTSEMSTALSAFTPNVPWARLACSQIVDHSGQGTSAATPQIASAAALWIQKYQSQWENYSEGWMRVEAVRKALFDSARLESSAQSSRLGRGSIQAQAALAQSPAQEAELRKQPQDTASFPFWRVITGLGLAAPDVRQRMLELEALQLTQRSHELEQLLADSEPDVKDLPPATRQKIIEALVSTPGASRNLQEALGKHAMVMSPKVTVPAQFKNIHAAAVERAMHPPLPSPVKRKLQVFAFDPSLGTRLETIGLNKTTIDVRWEELKPGPVGDYLEVVDVDPATGVCYAPVDLNHALPLSQGGLSPSESDPQFHQQMVYAVAMKTIAHFEYALGRVALWAPRIVKTKDGIDSYFVPRLRIYPHAIREANSFYSPEKSALLFGYFPASESNPGDNLPGQTVFCCVSHDIVAHETTHALLDGLHRRFREPTNVDVLAFHEAFSDIVALFQHFTVPEALRDQIARTRGDLAQQSLLGELAQQFGQGIGQFGALRDAIGDSKTGKWLPAVPSTADYENATEAHARGAVLVAAVFDAFLNIYRKRSSDLIRLATGGTGVLPPGDIPHTLVERLAREASKTASHVLNICIRALDYCPPVDITFGEYVRALITADYDLVPDDDLGYRVAFIQAFRRRGIYPQLVRNLSTESIRWESPELDLNIDECLQQMSLTWDLHANRNGAYESSRQNAYIFHEWIKNTVSDEQALSLGFYRSQKTTVSAGNEPGTLSPFEVHSVRPVRRVGPDGQQQLDLVVEITQTWRPASRSGDKYRGGSTLIIGLEDRRVRYTIRKRVAHADRIGTQQSFRLAMADSSMRSNYFDDTTNGREPFAMLHRG